MSRFARRPHPVGGGSVRRVDHGTGRTRSACSTEDAFQSLRREAGQSLDPRIVDLFIDAYPRLSGDAERLAEAAAPARSRKSDRPTTRLGTARRRCSAISHSRTARCRAVQLAQALGTSLGIGDTMALVALKLHNLVPFSSCALFLHSPESDTLRCRLRRASTPNCCSNSRSPTVTASCGWAAKNERALVNAKPGTDFEAAGIRVHASLQSALVIPLVFNTGLVGALAVYGQEAGCFNDDHRRLLARVAEQAAGVIANSITSEETKRDSLTNPLTGLPNTRFMFVHLTRELARAERLKSEVSLLVMDLDGFGDQRQLRPHRPATVCCARGGACAAGSHPSLRHLCAVCGRRVRRAALGMRTRRSAAQDA